MTRVGGRFGGCVRGKTTESDGWAGKGCTERLSELIVYTVLRYCTLFTGTRDGGGWVFGIQVQCGPYAKRRMISNKLVLSTPSLRTRGCKYLGQHRHGQ